jgi:predicted helicase
MRWNLLNAFDTIYILYLHGNAKKKETSPDGSKDENVFLIQQGVSINIFIKTGKKKKGSLATVYHSDIYGVRDSKYVELNRSSIKTIKWDKIEPINPYFFFVKKDFSNSAEYEEGFVIQELFPINSVGVVTANDTLFINEDKKTLKSNIKNKFNIEPNPKLFQSISYRPFDTRYIYFDDDKLERPREKVMYHYSIGTNIGLMVCRQQKTGGFYHCLVHNKIVESSYVSNKTSEIGYSFPLYIYPDKDGLNKDDDRQPNLNADIIKTIEQNIKLNFTNEKTENKKEFAPIDVLDYIYAVLHSPSYREKYKEFLKIDFPRVPYPQNAATFNKLVKLGSKLRELHLMENISIPKSIGFPVSGGNVIDKIQYSNEKVFINKDQYFYKVPLQVWEFYIGGYQPCQKWLKDRKGSELSFDDMEHYKKIVVILSETLNIQKQIDEVIEC